MPDLQLGKRARTNIVLTLVLVSGSLALAQFVPVAGAPASWPPLAWTKAAANERSTRSTGTSEPSATRPPTTRRCAADRQHRHRGRTGDQQGAVPPWRRSDEQSTFRPLRSDKRAFRPTTSSDKCPIP